MSMTWPQLISTMRRYGWEVEVSTGWVDVETPKGGQGGFERSARGLQEACQFYEEYCQPKQLPQSARTSTRASSHSKQAARRVIDTTQRRYTASLVILGCFAVIVLAIYHGLMVPAHGLACLVVMLAALSVAMIFARRVL